LESGGLVLRGRLPNFHHKQLAQETVRRLAGVRQIINKIEVVD
jgi:osmotically-inducible protein OsmY